MLLIWSTALAIAATPPPAQTRAYLDWFCSADNVWRYDGDLVLPPAPAGTTTGEGRRFTAPLEIGPAGIVGPVREKDALVIAADTPVAVVAEAFRTLAEQSGPTARIAVALAGPAVPGPPAPPGGDAVLAIVRQVRDDIRRDPTTLGRISARWLAASGGCHGALDQMAREGTATCAEISAQLAADLASPKCDMDADTAIAMFAVSWTGGEGVPVVLVPLAAHGPVNPSGEGTWGEVAAAFLATPGAAMGPPLPVPTPAPTGPVEGGVIGGGNPAFPRVPVLHPSQLQVKRKVAPQFPPAAVGLHLGDQRCLVRVHIGADGHPIDATVEGCPRLYHDAARDAILRWVWRPPPGGEAQTTIAIEFDAAQ